ncbi:NEAT domain-containing protein [Paenibacillus sp. 481]|uniref:NEAT domain-containing protein n=1 Tax=Paenibacillus sp. 481 TaxID=2835869 RepID=UPI001E3B5FF1|nr:NEAT domain-containing protein [Paenibacillus sp. 481]UHA74489.1 NEAT domain-containing protein [Paenibacillus sp. 481]
MRFQLKNVLAMFAVMFMLFAVVQVSPASAAIADGQYTINYKVLKDQTNQPSRLGDYTEYPAKLVVQNGKQFVHLKILSSSLITAFKTNQNGVLTNAEVVSSDAAANTRVVKFEVPNLSAKLNAYSEIYIPFIGYTGKYNVQLQFEPNTITPAI